MQVFRLWKPKIFIVIYFKFLRTTLLAAIGERAWCVIVASLGV